MMEKLLGLVERLDAKILELPKDKHKIMAVVMTGGGIALFALSQPMLVYVFQFCGILAAGLGIYSLVKLDQRKKDDGDN